MSNKPEPASGTEHELKTDPDVFDDVANGVKTFEIRLDDRGFKVGDTLLLHRTVHTGYEMRRLKYPLIYAGEQTRRTISHILRGPIYGLADGWVILSFAPSAPSLTLGGEAIGVAGRNTLRDSIERLRVTRRFVFKTRDRLIMADSCPDVDDEASVIMRPMWQLPPTVTGSTSPPFGEYRKYERTGEMHEGLPVFVERSEADSVFRPSTEVEGSGTYFGEKEP